MLIIPQDNDAVLVSLFDEILHEWVEIKIKMTGV